MHAARARLSAYIAIAGAEVQLQLQPDAAQSPGRADAGFHGWISAQFVRLDGRGLVLDCLLHVILALQLARSSHAQPTVWVACLASLLLGFVQAAWLVRQQQSYLRNRELIIVVRRLTAVALFCRAAPALAAGWGAHAGGSSTPAWAAARLLLVASAAAVNLHYMLWFRTRFSHCFCLSLVTAALLLTLPPSACSAALGTTSSTGSIGSGSGQCAPGTDVLLGVAQRIQNIQCGLTNNLLLLADPLLLPGWGSTPATEQRCLADRGPDRSISFDYKQPAELAPWQFGWSAWTNTRDPQADGSHGLGLLPPTAAAAAAAGLEPQACDMHVVCTALVGTVQLLLGVFLPAFLLYFWEQCAHVHFLRLRQRSSVNSPLRPRLPAQQALLPQRPRPAVHVHATNKPGPAVSTVAAASPASCAVQGCRHAQIPKAPEFLFPLWHLPLWAVCAVCLCFLLVTTQVAWHALSS